jgi:quaternary ammonium compound-resistance protein SugE
MAWFIVVVAGLLEVGWVVGMKLSEGFTKVGPSVATALAMAASMYLLAVAVRTLPIGTAYAVWVGIGALGSAAVGMLRFGESVHPLRIACLALLLAAVVGLKVTSRLAP